MTVEIISKRLIQVLPEDVPQYCVDVKVDDRYSTRFWVPKKIGENTSKLQAFLNANHQEVLAAARETEKSRVKERLFEIWDDIQECKKQLEKVKV